MLRKDLSVFKRFPGISQNLFFFTFHVLPDMDREPHAFVALDGGGSKEIKLTDEEKEEILSLDLSELDARSSEAIAITGLLSAALASVSGISSTINSLILDDVEVNEADRHILMAFDHLCDVAKELGFPLNDLLPRGVEKFEHD